MRFIVYDIEATCWEGTPPGTKQETIEIGAYRVDRFGNVEGAFSRLIKPIIHPQLSLYCQRLTNIDQSDINRARGFEEVAEAFKEWIGYYDHEDYVLASWGRFDGRQLARDCQVHNLNDEWLDPHIDLKEQYRRIRGLPKTRGLKSAIKHEGFFWEGEEHRALDDAKNTTQLFQKLLDEWQF